MIIKHIPEFKRPREKAVRNGVKSLADHELLAILLRSGYRNQNALELSKRILSKYNLKDLSVQSLDALVKFKGVGIVNAIVLSSAFELSQRVILKHAIPQIHTPQDVIKTISFIRDKRREHFVAVYLNARHQLIKTHVISIGTLDVSIAHPRDVLEPAIRCNAASFILAHNHPSGDSDPSQADILLSHRIAEAGKIVGIEMKDHVILSRNGNVSLREKDLM